MLSLADLCTIAMFVGVISAMCLDSRQCYLALGTSSGYHTVWDLRFQMPITTFPQHPMDSE